MATQRRAWHAMHMRTSLVAPARFFFGALVLLTACKGQFASTPPLSKDKVDETPAETPALAADGPRLVVLHDRTPVMEGPSFGTRVLGELRLGASVVRSMNAVSHASCMGGWYAIRGEIEIGTVVAFVSGLGKVNDPWGDVVNWYRDMTINRLKYRLVAKAIDAG